MERKRAKTENIETVLNGPRKTNVRNEIRAASTRQKKRQEEDSVLLRKRENIRKETEKEISIEKGPLLPVRQEKHASWYATIFRRGNAKGVRMRLLAPTSVLTQQIPKWMHMGGYVCILPHKQSR